MQIPRKSARNTVRHYQKKRTSHMCFSCNKLKHIIESKKLNIDTKIGVFDTYVTSVFLYNCELWTLTKAQEEQIDIFQRKQLRRIIKIRWPRIISNLLFMIYQK